MEDFVTYEQALALKNLGFSEECFYHYYIVTKELKSNVVVEENALLSDFLMDFNYDDEYNCYISAPTLVQTQKWLRKEKGLYLIWDMGQDRKHDSKFAWYVCDRHGYIVDTLASEIKYDSPEEALSEGITECLNFLELENDKEK